jgi:peptide/nickel transport system substrate-binding protein
LKSVSIKLCSLLLVLSLVLSGCGGKSSNPEPLPDEQSADEAEAAELLYKSPEAGFADEIFSVNYNSEYNLNPYFTGSKTNAELIPLIYEGLFKVNKDFSYERVLCESYYTLDGLKYTFKIKPNIKMHDGEDLNILDVIYSINLARESERYSARLSSITAIYPENGAVCVELGQKNFSFPVCLDFPIVRDMTGYRDYPAGTGAYYFVKAENYTYLRAFDNYRDYSELPIARIYLKEYSADELVTAFDSGLVDLVSSSKSDMHYLEFSGNTESRYRDTTVLHFLGLNSDCKFFKAANHRWLLSTAIDRERLAAETINGVPVTIPLNPAAFFYSDKYDKCTSPYSELDEKKIEYLVEDYDRDGLLEYIDTDNSVTEFSLRFIVNKENPAKLETAHKIYSALLDAGFDVSLLELEWSAFLDALRKGNYDLYYGEVMLSADFDLTCLFSYGGSANYGVYDPELQARISDFNSTFSADKGNKAEYLYSYIAETMPIISLMFEKDTVYTHRGIVSGMSPVVHNIYNDLSSWKINLSGNM